MNVGSTGHEERGDGINIFQHRPLYMERAEKTRSAGLSKSRGAACYRVGTFGRRVNKHSYHLLLMIRNVSFEKSLFDWLGEMRFPSAWMHEEAGILDVYL